MSSAFADFLRGHGFIVDRLIADGEIHRFAHTSKKHDKPCWAILFADGTAGVWGDWRNSDSNFWHQEGREYKALTRAEREIIDAQRLQASERIEAQRLQAAQDNLAAWDAITHIGTDCDYLKKKRVGNHGLKIDGQGNAYCPARDITGKLWNFQNISASPKLFRHGRMSGCFHIIEGNREQIVITSGYATGASIHEATGLCVVVCFGDSNVLAVAKILKDAGWKGLLVAADNDSDGSNSGNKIAQRACDELGFPAVMPDTPGDFNDAALRGEKIYRYFYETTPVFSFGELLGDRTPMPEDVIAPRVLTEGGMLVFGGAPKVGKSDFMLSWLCHMAAGIPFMGMTPPRPLRVFYLQAEVQYHYLRERVKMVDISPSHTSTIERNLFITPQVRMLLDESGVKTVGHTIRQCFGAVAPDIIAIDPISNVYDKESENDNAQMMAFLSQRVEALRAYASEKTSFMLVHHTKKIAKDELAKDPFQMFSGASSLRRYYTTGMLMFRPDEEVSECVLTYEVRNGARLPNINVDKNMGRWIIVPKEQSRIGKHDAEKALDEERQRKVAILIDELHFEMSQGRNYTARAFADYMAGKSGLGSSSTVNRLLSEMLAQGDVWTEQEGDGKRLFLRA